MNKYSAEYFAKSFYDEHNFPLAYQKGMSCEERENWKQALTDKIRELMAFPKTMYEEPKVHLLLSKKQENYRIEKYEMSPEPNLWITFFLMVPDFASEKHQTPGVLCLPGTGWTKEALCGEDFCDLDYDPPQPITGIGHRYYYANTQALHYVKNGMTAIACEDIGVGEHAGESLDVNDIEKLLIGQGRSIMGVTVEIRLALLKWLKKLPFVDRNRIAISGHSLGVDSAMHVVLLDTDVKAFVYNDFICDTQQRISTICPPEHFYPICWHMYPGIYRWYSYPDLLAAYAPRKLFITEGGMTEHLERLAEVYAEYGALENFRYDYYREYSAPENRKHDHEPLPKGLTHAEYFEFANVNPEKHFFKFEAAIPWLKDALK
ncbi:MAG TPA: hypothetical protein DD391_01510 [Clostridiales bacterium]|nr:hypothetical protein [Clostridiales bacterium]HBL81274.1 hypothetical protein [Clostridiales bacterium]